MRALRALAVGALTIAAASMAVRTARGQEPPPEPTSLEPPAPAPQVEAAKPPPGEETVPAKAPERTKSAEPKPVELPAPETTFVGDPVADGAILVISLGFAGTLDAINSTGEIRPQQISSTFRSDQLLVIDRGAITQTFDGNAGTYSTVGLAAAGAFAAIDPVISGLRENSVQAGVVDGIMYAESISLSYAMTNIVKIAVRRPRPKAYAAAAEHRGDPNYSNADTDSALSFFSGHAAITAAIGATATYLAFARSSGLLRPIITATVAVALTGFVSFERVRAGAHFPTDVIAASIAGAGVGVIVPHLHRSENVKQRHVWIGIAPTERGEGGTATLSGIF